MRKVLLIMIAVICLVSCKTTEVANEKIVYRDKIVYQDKVIHDSIYQKEYEKEYIKGDTVYIDHLVYKYVGKSTHDTLYISKTDTLVTYKETIVTDHKQNGIQKFFMLIGVIVVLAAIIYLVYLLLKKRNFLH